MPNCRLHTVGQVNVNALGYDLAWVIHKEEWSVTNRVSGVASPVFGGVATPGTVGGRWCKNMMPKSIIFLVENLLIVKCHGESGCKREDLWAIFLTCVYEDILRFL